MATYHYYNMYDKNGLVVKRSLSMDYAFLRKM